MIVKMLLARKTAVLQAYVRGLRDGWRTSLKSAHVYDYTYSLCPKLAASFTLTASRGNLFVIPIRIHSICPHCPIR